MKLNYIKSKLLRSLMLGMTVISLQLPLAHADGGMINGEAQESQQAKRICCLPNGACQDPCY